MVFEYAALLCDPVLRSAGVPRGDGAPVLLVAGFLADDESLGVMRAGSGGLATGRAVPGCLVESAGRQQPCMT